jgi:hypothetical protein
MVLNGPFSAHYHFAGAGKVMRQPMGKFYPNRILFQRQNFLSAFGETSLFGWCFFDYLKSV